MSNLECHEENQVQALVPGMRFDGFELGSRHLDGSPVRWLTFAETAHGVTSWRLDIKCARFVRREVRLGLASLLGFA